jgi:hypothetical protein
VAGGFIVQFWDSQRLFTSPNPTSYPTHNHGTALALAHHVARALADATAGHPARRRQAELGVPGRSRGVLSLIAAVQRVLDELAAVLEQIRAELPARA